MDRVLRLSERLSPRLEALYGEQAEYCLEKISQLCDRYRDLPSRSTDQIWDQRDTLLISYADQVQSDTAHPLPTLKKFLVARGLNKSFRLLHLLPFFPATSDDGFSVVDYRQVDPNFGTWDDIAALREQFQLMFDMVLNHASRASAWFRKYQQGIDPYTRYFIEADPGEDLSLVVRPRTSPLLTPFETSRGRRHVWTTFSDDQVDLNYAEPKVLLEMLDVLLGYIRNGARIVRMDAIAYLWKIPGTTCIHLPQTHEVVKLFRDVVDFLAPGTLLLTETNVPHAENISYWGNSDEAHVIYNFTLAPLLLDALLTGDGTYLKRWLAESSAPPLGTTYLNFTASHDGIGVRPLESLVPKDRIARLQSAVQARGGLVSEKVNSDGSKSPYELNITYFSALGAPPDTQDAFHVKRFMASQAIMLSLRGIPAVYFHSLFGTPNDLDGVKQTGRSRSINRRKFDITELEQLLDSPTTGRKIFDAYQHLLATRAEQPAFHPDGDQTPIPCNDAAIMALLRTAPNRDQTILVAANLSDRIAQFDLERRRFPVIGSDLLSGEAYADDEGKIVLRPYQVVWIPMG